MGFRDAAKHAAQTAAATAAVAANVHAGQVDAAHMQKHQMGEQQRIRTQQIEQATIMANQPTTSGRP